jgi:methionyl aminopeptidase
MKLKTTEEIEILTEGGAKLAQIMRELVEMCQPGTSSLDLDKSAEEKILSIGGRPSFKGFGPVGEEFPATLCISPNDMVVHGIPSEELTFKEGDLIGIDIGMEYKGLYTDHAVTVPIGEISQEAKELLEITKKCLQIAIDKAQVGNHVGDVGYAVQKHAEDAGYGVVRKLTGHAVGYAVHEEPRIPNYGSVGEGEVLEEGAVLALEPMINIGTHDVKTATDGWGIVTADNKLAAHFEHTVVVTKNGPKILTI